MKNKPGADLFVHYFSCDHLLWKPHCNLLKRLLKAFLLILPTKRSRQVKEKEEGVLEKAA